MRLHCRQGRIINEEPRKQGEAQGPEARQRRTNFESFKPFPGEFFDRRLSLVPQGAKGYHQMLLTATSLLPSGWALLSFPSVSKMEKYIDGFVLSFSTLTAVLISTSLEHHLSSPQPAGIRKIIPTVVNPCLTDFYFKIGLTFFFFILKKSFWQQVDHTWICWVLYF